MKSPTQTLPAVAYLENRRGKGTTLNRAHLPTLRAPGQKGATGPEGAAACLQGVFVDLFRDTTFNQYFVDLFRTQEAKKE